jgi:hypothetical protein
MKRTALKRTAPIKPSARRMKSSRPKMTPARKAAKGQDCTLMLPGCTNQTDTVVLCHLREFGGGGMGCKPHDSEAVLGCAWCHAVIDGRQEPAPVWTLGDIAWALIRTLRAQRAAGVLIFKGEEN